MHFRRYFLRENGLEPSFIKYSYGILGTLHNKSANVENGTRRIFLFSPKNIKKIYGRFEPLSCRKNVSAKPPRGLNKRSKSGKLNPKRSNKGYRPDWSWLVWIR